MSHFAEINEQKIVQRVIVADNNLPNEGYDWVVETYGGDWVQTSYNSNFRKNFAGIGFTYDEGRDAFIPPKPFDSWLLDEDTCQWTAPIHYPEDGLMYQWDEEQGDWTPIVFDQGEISA